MPGRSGENNDKNNNNNGFVLLVVCESPVGCFDHSGSSSGINVFLIKK
jgi:hypothetical protein